MNGLPAITGIEWLKQGFALFRQQPGMLSMLLFSTLIFTLLLSSLPLLGGILPIALIPAFNMVIFQACRDLDAGQRATPAVLFTGLRRDAVFPLLKLGMVYFALGLLLSLAVSPWIDNTAFLEAIKAMRAKTQPTLPPQTVYAIMTLMGLMAVTFISLSFAPQLVHWKKMPTFKAIFYSVFAMAGSLGPVLVMLLTWFFAYLTAMSLVALLLGRTPLLPIGALWVHLVFTTNLLCALYAAYRQLLAHTAESIKT